MILNIQINRSVSDLRRKSRHCKLDNSLRRELHFNLCLKSIAPLFAENQQQPFTNQGCPISGALYNFLYVLASNVVASSAFRAFSNEVARVLDGTRSNFLTELNACTSKTEDVRLACSVHE